MARLTERLRAAKVMLGETVATLNLRQGAHSSKPLSQKMQDSH
jgi:hypothetical protein